MFKTQVLRTYPYNEARVTKISTAHGDIITPTFMPVGTHAALNCMTPEDLEKTHSQIILGGNTYHMLCTPGLEMIKHAGGMHQFMGWPKPMLTDSGGFQVMSLARHQENCHFDEQGAHIRNPISGQKIHLTPRLAYEAQKIIGADITMAFDHCVEDTDNKTIVYEAMQRTHQWLDQIRDYHEQDACSAYGYHQALFGIIQGGFFRDLREESAEFVVSMELDGIAFGGGTIGYEMEKTVTIIDWIKRLLPRDKTLYTMGVGLKPQDLITLCAKGIDLFDCVAPTRNARHGTLYSGEIVIEDDWLKFKSEHPNESIHIKKACYAKDDSPIMAGCSCYTCQHFSRAYLHLLYREKSIAYATLACIHNVHVMQTICRMAQDLLYQA